MDGYSGVDKNNKKIKYKNKIKDFPNNDVFQIKNQNVKITNLNTLIESKYIFTWNMDHNEFLDTAKCKFKYIEFGQGCAIGLEQYRHKIDIEQQKILMLNNIPKNSKEIEQWKDQFYDVLYANFEALNDFLDIDNKVGNINENERYHSCKYGCDRLINCGAHIRYFGADCVDETLKDKNNPDVKKNRTIDNNIYWLHLRPYNINCDAPLWFLGLRIHFRWITNRKIEIGWIGRHLFAPCPKRDPADGKIKKCNRPECPIYKDPKGNEYINFRKDWT